MVSEMVARKLGGLKNEVLVERCQASNCLRPLELPGIDKPAVIRLPTAGICTYLGIQVLMRLRVKAASKPLGNP